MPVYKVELAEKGKSTNVTETEEKYILKDVSGVIDYSHTFFTFSKMSELSKGEPIEITFKNVDGHFGVFIGIHVLENQDELNKNTNIS